MYLKSVVFSVILYKKLEEDYTFLGMYLGMV